MTTVKTINVLGREYALTLETVVVIDTEISRTSQVHGEGVVINGFGATKVDSSVKTARSIWFRREDGSEGRWTADFDMPVRAGHHLSFIRVKGPGLIKLPDAIRAGADPLPAPELLAAVSALELKQYWLIEGQAKDGFGGVACEDFYMSVSYLFGIILSGGLFKFVVFGPILVAACLPYILLVRPVLNVLGLFPALSFKEALHRRAETNRQISDAIKKCAAEPLAG